MILFICFLLELLSGMEVDLFVPSCTQLQTCFTLSPFLVELTLGVNLVAYCFATFFASPCADRYGNKNTILLGCLIFIIGSIICAVAPNFSLLLVGRFLQGFGIAFPCVLAYIVIADHYPKNEQIRLIGYLTAGITVGMAIAPIIGSFVAHYFEWRANFYVLTAFGLIAFLFSAYYLPNEKGTGSSLFQFNTFKPVLKCPTTIFSILALVVMIQGFWVFVALAPILYVGYYKVSLLHFGFYQGALSFSFAIISMLGGKLVDAFGEEKVMNISLKSVFLSGILVIICLVFDFGPLGITVCLCFHNTATALPIIILWPHIINLTDSNKTQRSSIATAMRLIFTAISIQVVSFFYQDSFFILGLFIAFISFASYPLGIIAYKKLQNYKQLN